MREELAGALPGESWAPSHFHLPDLLPFPSGSQPSHSKEPCVCWRTTAPRTDRWLEESQAGEICSDVTISPFSLCVWPPSCSGLVSFVFRGAYRVSLDSRTRAEKCSAGGTSLWKDNKERKIGGERQGSVGGRLCLASIDALCVFTYDFLSPLWAGAKISSLALQEPRNSEIHFL